MSKTENIESTTLYKTTINVRLELEHDKQLQKEKNKSNFVSNLITDYFDGKLIETRLSDDVMNKFKEDINRTYIIDLLLTQYYNDNIAIKDTSKLFPSFNESPNSRGYKEQDITARVETIPLNRDNELIKDRIKDDKEIVVNEVNEVDEKISNNELDEQVQIEVEPAEQKPLQETVIEKENLKVVDEINDDYESAIDKDNDEKINEVNSSNGHAANNNNNNLSTKDDNKISVKGINLKNWKK